MSLFKSNPSENGSTETFSPFTKFQEAFAPKMALVKSNVIYNQFLIEPIKNPSTDVDTEGLVCESSLHLEAPNTNENAVFIWVSAHKLHFGHPDLLRVGNPQAGFSRCPKVSQRKNLAVVNYFLFHPHFSCICLSSFTIRSRFFAVFMKVGRWSAWVIFALPGGFSRSPALR